MAPVRPGETCKKAWRLSVAKSLLIILSTSVWERAIGAGWSAPRGEAQQLLVDVSQGSHPWAQDACGVVPGEVDLHTAIAEVQNDDTVV